MKKSVIMYAAALMISLFLLQSGASAQQAQPEQGNGNVATQDRLDQDSKNLDGIIKDLNTKIQSVIQKNKMMDIKDIKIIPYQTDYVLGSDYIQIERHMFIRDESQKIIGEKRKTMKFTVAGGNITKIESMVYERDYSSSNETLVEITDASPLSDNKDSITIKQTVNKKVVISGKALNEIKNTTAFPVRNDFKRDFYIQHLSYFYNLILGIAETYSKSSKDSDTTVTEFLRGSTRY